MFSVEGEKRIKWIAWLFAVIGGLAALVLWQRPNYAWSVDNAGSDSMEAITSLGIWLIPIVAIIIGGITGIVKMILNHQERIAMIERGIHPDAVEAQRK